MASTLYEGYRIGKNGGERWTGTIKRSLTNGRFVATDGAKVPKGGSVIRTPQTTTNPKQGK